MVSYEEVAEYAFMAFIAIAIIAGLVVGYLAYDADPNIQNYRGTITLIMLILGIVVGLISITAKEVQPFLIAAIALIVTGTGINVWAPLESFHPLLHHWASEILSYIVAFVSPAAVIIAIKVVWALARKK